MYSRFSRGRITVNRQATSTLVLLAVLKQRLHRRRKPQRYQYLAGLLQNESLSAGQLDRLRQRMFDDIVHFATNHCDFYQRRHAGIMLPTSGIDITVLPVLEKADVRRHRDAMRDRDLASDAYRLGHTGGSTGKPLSFYYNDDKTERMRAGMMRSYRWCGWEPGEKILNFWGARQDIETGLKRRYKEFIAAERTLAAWEFSERELAAWAGLIRSWRPVLLQGYASILDELARHVLRRRLKLPPIKGVYSTAEILHDGQRETIESAFGCHVFNQYGSREVPNIALECRYGGLHVFSDTVWLESQADGRLLLTSLTDRVMPFIRYANGDTGRLKDGDCPCGSPFPLMEMGLCRANDIIHTPDGRRFYPSWFIHLLDGQTSITQFQFEQTADDGISLRLVTTGPLRAEDARGLKKRLRDELDMRLEITRVAEIPRPASGKHRFVIGRSSG